MSTVTVEEVKEFLRMTHSHDDPLLQRLTDAAEDYALKYLDRDELPEQGEACPDSDSSEDSSSDSGEVAPSVHTAICMLVQANYDAEDPDKVREAAENLLHPYRCKLGV